MYVREVHSTAHAPSDPCLLNNHNMNVLESTDFILNSLTFSWTNTHMLVHPLPIWQASPTSRWSKEVESGRGGVLGVCWSFIQVIVPSGPLLCGEQGGGLAFSGCYKICSLYKPLNRSSFFLFLAALWFPPSPTFSLWSV